MILSTLRIRNYPEDEVDQFPWTLPIIKNLDESRPLMKLCFLVLLLFNNNLLDIFCIARGYGLSIGFMMALPNVCA